jgi:hypothetical protein
MRRANRHPRVKPYGPDQQPGACLGNDEPRLCRLNGPRPSCVWNFNPPRHTFYFHARRRPPRRRRGFRMLDLAMLSLGLGAFALLLGYVVICDRL